MFDVRGHFDQDLSDFRSGGSPLVCVGHFARSTSSALLVLGVTRAPNVMQAAEAKPRPSKKPRQNIDLDAMAHVIDLEEETPEYREARRAAGCYVDPVLPTVETCQLETGVLESVEAAWSAVDLTDDTQPAC